MFLELVILVSVMSTVWECTDSCVKKFRCVLAIYLMTVLSSSYGIIMDCAINSLGHGNNVVDGINATYKHYLKLKMKLIGKLESNGTA